MCGITQVSAHRPLAAPVDREQLLRVRDAMLHRGPDGAGPWNADDYPVGLPSLRTQLAKMRRSAGGNTGDVLVSIGKAPRASVEDVKRYRDAKYFEALS